MRDQAAGIIQDGIQEGLPFAAAGVLDVGAKQHVRLPDLITKFSFKLLSPGRSQQLPFGEAVLLDSSSTVCGEDWP
jgi:hypothetical protein